MSDKWVRVSGVTGFGIEDLKEEVQKMFLIYGGPEDLAPGSARQVDCLQNALEEIHGAIQYLDEGWTDDVIALALEQGRNG